MRAVPAAAPAAGILCASGLFASPASAQTYTWNGGGADSNWSTAANWSGGTAPPASGADLVFDGSTRTSPTMTSDYSLNSLSFASSASSFTLGGTSQTLTLGSGGLTNSSSVIQRLSMSNLVISADQTWSLASQGVVVNSAITGTANITYTSIAGVTSGAVLLNGTDTSTGGITINNADVLLTGSSLAFASRTITMGGANSLLDIGGSATTSLGSATVNANGQSTVRFLAGTGGNATLNIGDASSFGSLQVYNSSTLGNATVNVASNSGIVMDQNASGGTAKIILNGSAFLNLYSASSLDTATVSGASASSISFTSRTANAAIGSISMAGRVSLSNQVMIGGLNGVDSITGVVSGSGSLVKSGTGTLTLTGANTYSGGTTISSGTVVARGGSASGNSLSSGGLGTGAVSVSSGATLSVGEKMNSANAAQAVSTLDISSLTLASNTGNTTPLLTFNLGSGGASDKIVLTSSGTEFTFSGAGNIVVGFASATGSSLASGTYTLLSFTTPEATSSMPAISQFSAIAEGNLADLNGTFSYQTSGGNVTALLFNLNGADATPEPGSLALAAMGVLSLAGSRAAMRRRRTAAQ